MDCTAWGVWGGGIAIGLSNAVGEVAKWHPGMQIDYDIKTDGASVIAHTDIDNFPVVNGVPSLSDSWSPKATGDNDNDACDDTGQWKRTGFASAVPQNKWVYRTVTYWNAPANNTKRYALSDCTHLVFKVPESARGKTITIKNIRYTVVEKLHE